MIDWTYTQHKKIIKNFIAKNLNIIIFFVLGVKMKKKKNFRRVNDEKVITSINEIFRGHKKNW
jgi:hypothetical protein